MLWLMRWMRPGLLRDVGEMWVKPVSGTKKNPPDPLV